MSISFYLTVLFALFFAFSIGLNLGLYGVISIDGWHETSPKDHVSNVVLQTRKTVPVEPPRVIQAAAPAVNTQTGLSATDTAALDPLRFDAIIYEAIKDGGGPKKTAALSDAMSDALAAAGKEYAEKAPGPVESFVSSGGHIPVVLLTYNRYESLSTTIASLLGVRGVRKEDVLILQDGAMAEITDVARRHEIELVQNTEGLHLRGAAHVDGATRIARHYKYSLTTGITVTLVQVPCHYSFPPTTSAFKLRPKAPAIIIIEDDLLLSPDFLE